LLLVRRLSAIAVALSLALLAVLALAACGDDGPREIETGYPEAGMDSFENTTAVVEVDIALEGVSARPFGGELVQYELSGPLDVERGDPADRDDDGLADVQTTMINMRLTGDGPLGPVVVTLNPDETSGGYVEQMEHGQDFPATSYFDVFLQVNLPTVDLTLITDGPVRMEATLSSLPPGEATEDGDEDVYRTSDGEAVPLITPTDAALRVGRIVDALHIPEPGPGPMPGPGGPTPTPEPGGASPTPEPEETPDDGLSSIPVIRLFGEPGCQHSQTSSGLLILITARIIPSNDEGSSRGGPSAPLVSLLPGAAGAPPVALLGTEEPLVGGTVTVRADGPAVAEGEDLQSAVTDAQGNARFTFPITQVGNYSLDVEGVTDADGNSLEISSDSDTSFVFSVGETCAPPRGF